MKEVTHDPRVRKAWEKWLALTRERCHLHYALEGGNLENHVSTCFNAALSTAARVAGDLHGFRPARILEVGSSVGFNCFGLAHQFPTATIVGIEPDVEAVEVAKAMAESGNHHRLHFVPGVCEQLPFPDRSFDLIVCHTVIEHVGDVGASISEMARVMSSEGLLHLEAPNYMWPKEPHLGILIPPLCPKPLIRLLAKIQGSGKNAVYADHLKLVHPLLLERIFRRNGLRYENRVREKMVVAASGETNVIKAYHGFGRLLCLMKKMGMVEIVLNFALSLGLYPSVLYTVRHRSS